MGKNIFASRLKELRESLEMSQTVFADSIELNQQTYSLYERGKRTPADVVVKIAEKYNISTDWLLGISNNPKDNLPLNTCSDIFKILLKLAALNGVWIDDGFYKSEGGNGYSSVYDARYSKIMMLYFNDSTINSALQGWRKMKNLLNAGTIDQEVYDLWIEKTLKQLDIPYHADGEVLTLGEKELRYKEELPFN